MTAVRDAGTSGASVGGLVRRLAGVLDAAGIPDAAQEARDLVAALLDVPRFWPSMHGAEPAPPELVARAESAAERRASGAPFAYAVGRAPFRHLTLEVDERVLIPRQETELLVEMVLALEPRGAAADVGTGSGAIALALAAEGGYDRVIATDVSRGALALARRNADRVTGSLRARVELRHGSLLAPLVGEQLSVLVSNPPYIAFEERDSLPRSVRDWEPPLALFSGREGLAATAEIVAGAGSIVRPGGVLALEVDERRAGRVADLVRAEGCWREVAVHRDLTDRDRFVVARRAGP